MDMELSDEYAAEVTIPEEKIGPLIDDMPPPDREIFIRKYYFLETSAEIAAAMGRTADDVNQRLSRGRKRLREQLAKGGTTLYAQKSL